MVIGTNPSHAQNGNLPVTKVAWENAANYCAAIGGRLPAEA
jgi:formylglycine-generating enzyme required for sulfatase activity